MEIETEFWVKRFPAITICRHDLRDMFDDEDILKITDRAMEHIAIELGDCYSDYIENDLQDVAWEIIDNG